MEWKVKSNLDKLHLPTIITLICRCMSTRTFLCCYEVLASYCLRRMAPKLWRFQVVLLSISGTLRPKLSGIYSLFLQGTAHRSILKHSSAAFWTKGKEILLVSLNLRTGHRYIWVQLLDRWGFGHWGQNIFISSNDCWRYDFEWSCQLVGWDFFMTLSWLF